MSRPVLRAVVFALIFFFIGTGTAAIVLAAIPAPGSAPAIYDDFSWSSTSNGFWHVNAIGGKGIIKDSLLTLEGNSVELDRRLQTDPHETVVVARVRGIHFHRFALGVGVYHAGTVSLEFDDDGVKCGRGTDFGWKVDFMKGWEVPPAKQWFYLLLSVKNPYPDTEEREKAEEYADKTGTKLKPVTLTCSMYDAQGHLVASVTPRVPPPNASYPGLDEAYLRTWNSGNRYQIDWLYAGPPSGIPAKSLLTRV
jgi:hypothetical protein